MLSTTKRVLKARISRLQKRVQPRQKALTFTEYVKQAWLHCEPFELEWSWHFERICIELHHIAYKRKDGIGDELTICVPPSSGKSMLISVLWPTWVWTWWPESRWISCTYEKDLAVDLAAKARNLMLSEWYQERWPLKFTKTSDKYYVNQFGGFRRSVGTMGAITGTHAHFHIGDDLVKEQESRIGTPQSISRVMNEANSFWLGTMGSRNIDHGATARVLVGQMLHLKDPANRTIKEHHYRSIILPAQFDPQRADPLDERKVKGELLSSRFSLKYLEKMRIQLGLVGFAAQFEQNPIPDGGRVLQLDYLSQRYTVLPSAIQQTIQSKRIGQGQQWLTAWDMTFKGKTTSDYVVGQCWVLYQTRLYLIDQCRMQAGFMSTKEMMKNFLARYPWVNSHIMEDGANADAIEDSNTDILGLELRPHGGGCLARTQAVEGIWSAHNVWLPADKDWMFEEDGFIEEHINFTGNPSEHDDQVSASSLAILELVGNVDGLSAFVNAMLAFRDGSVMGSSLYS